jgi:hypothetical protein
VIQSGSATVQSTKTRHNEDMNLETFRASTTDDKPPSELSTPLEAMWYQGKGDWEEAHRLAQSQNNPSVSWVHAHLHRVEGDLRNAAYWYRLADRPVCNSSLDDEWEEIVAELI